MEYISRNILKGTFAAVTAAILFLTQLPAQTYAAQITSLSQLDQAQVSFTFDDGFASTRTLAAPILEARGIDGVLYLTSGSADGSLSLDANQPGATWNQVRELQNMYGWEIGGHMQTHPEMPTRTPAQNIAEITSSNAAFAANGLNVTNFASPFGAYDNATLTEILKYYKSHRGFADRDALNTTPYNKSVLKVQSVETTTTVAQVQAWVDQAVANKQWLILVFHDVAPQQNPNYVYTTTTTDLTAIADYVQARVDSGQLRTVTTEQGIALPGVNVLENSGFEAGIASGWSTDNAEVVKADNNNNGNYSSPSQSISLTGAATTGHLFSATTAVDANTSYILDSFYNATNLTSGEFGFYIDEYDAAGNWVSGQQLGAITNGTIGFFTSLYNVPSPTVRSVRVQTYLTGGATGVAYIDSTVLHSVDGNNNTAPVAQTISPATPEEAPAAPETTPAPTITAEPTPVQEATSVSDTVSQEE